jgi:hypothetical protein
MFISIERYSVNFDTQSAFKFNNVQSILDSVHIIRFFLRWNCYSRNKLGNWGLDTMPRWMKSFDTNDFMSCMLISFNKDVIIIMSINNDGIRLESRMLWTLLNLNADCVSKLTEHLSMEINIRCLNISGWIELRSML